MDLVQRAQDILLKPKETGPAIAAEPGDAASLYSNYLIYLALVPAVAGFIGRMLLGSYGFHVRMPIVSGLISAVVGYVMSLVVVYVLSLIANALARNFGGTKDPLMALKLVVYASTAGFVGGVFGITPQTAALGVLASLYSIYLIYTGVPVLMKCPPEKAGPFTAVLVVCGFVVSMLTVAMSGMHSGGF